MHIPEVLASQKRVADPTWYKYSGCAPKRKYLKCIVAGHLLKSEMRFLQIHRTCRICTSFLNSKASFKHCMTTKLPDKYMQIASLEAQSKTYKTLCLGHV